MDNALYQLLGIKDCDLKNSQTITENGVPVYILDLIYTGETPAICEHCGEKLYKHDSRFLNVVDTPLMGMPARLNFEYKRYRCKKCKKLWQPTFDLIDEDRKMTKRAFLKIAQQSLEYTFEEVSRDYSLSPNTIKNIFVDFLSFNETFLRFKTPAFIGLDEIMFEKIGTVTVVTDLEHHTLYDVFMGRTKDALREYFSKIPLSEREQILWVCSDMYRPFKTAIEDLLPNARWVVDHFHVTMKANDAIDVIRRKTQKRDDTPKSERIHFKKRLAYTLKTRLKDLDAEEAEKIRLLRKKEKTAPFAIAYDLKEDFFNIYDNNPYSKDNAIDAFLNWEQSIPEDATYDKFREIAKMVHNHCEEIFNYWDCPIAITNGYTECSNRIVREKNLRGRGYSFEVLRGRTLYRKANLDNIKKNKMLIGPLINEYEPVFRIDSLNEEEIV